MKSGWLVVNGFLHSEKFNNLYKFFTNSAKELGIHLQVVPTTQLIATAQEGFSQKPDFVLFWDKDVCLARRLQNCGLKLFNCADAIENCDSKTLTVMHLLNVVPMPQTLFSPKTFDGVGYGDLGFVQVAAQKLGLPMVIKESFGSFGQQVYLAHTVDKAKQIVQSLAGKDFLMQQFVAESFGKDVRVNVVGGRVINAVMRQGAEGDFRSNVTLGGNMQACQIDPLMEQYALSACQTLGLDFAGVDFLLSNNGPLLCEVNSNMHFQSTFECTGVDLSKEILQHVLQKIN